MDNEFARLRLARATARAHRAVARATRIVMRAHQGRIEPFNELARAYLAEADAQKEKNAAKGLRRHARFAQKFLSLTKHEIRALGRELQRIEIEARIADARSRGEPPSLKLKRSAARQPAVSAQPSA